MKNPDDNSVELTYLSLISSSVYILGILLTFVLYYRVLRLNTLDGYSGMYGLLLMVMIFIMVINMAYSLVRPPQEDDNTRDEESRIVQRTMNVIAFIFISNIMIRDYNRSHTANSKIVQNLIVIITVTLMFNNVILWIPQQDIKVTRVLRDVRTVSFVIGLGFMVIFIIDVVKRGSENVAPEYL